MLQKSLPILVFCWLALPLCAQVTFVVDALPANTPAEDSLFVAGTFNDWKPGEPAFRFSADSSGRFSLTLRQIQPPFEFKITRGSWKRVEGDALGQQADNRHYDGSARDDTVYLQILSWEGLPLAPTHGWATLLVKAIPENTPPDASLYVVGSFNKWHPGDPNYKLQREPDGSYSIRIPLWQDTTYYKFSRGAWETVEGRPNGRARVNRQLILQPGEAMASPIGVEIESWEDLSGNPINIYTILLLLAAIQGLLLILAINSLQNNNRAANRILSVLILLISVALAGRVSTYDREIFQRMPHLLLLPDVIYFLYAPVFFLYVKRLLHVPAHGKKTGHSYWHFVPFALQLLAYFPLLTMPKWAFIDQVVNLGLKPFFAWAGGLALLYNAAYWWACRRTIGRYEKEAGNTHAFETNLEFLRVVMWLKAACLGLWAATYFIGGLGLSLHRDFSFLTDKTTDALWAAFSLTVFFLGYYTMRQPEIFKLPDPDPATPKPPEEEAEEKAAAAMGAEEMQSVKEKLEQLMQAEQPYRNPGLTLFELAQMAGTNAHSLSRVINEGFDMNFNDLINSYRVEEFKRLALQEEYQNHTLLAIAFFVGFNSKSAFNRSFKKLEDCTPREYLKGITS